MFACTSACAPRDPAADTVKVDFKSMEAEAAAAAQQQRAEQQKREEEARRRAEAEEAARRAEREAEARRQAALEEEAAARQRQEEEARRADEQRRAEAARQQEEAKRAREEAERAQAARQAEEERLAKEQERKTLVAAFLKKNGFSGVSAGKKSLFRTSYPLHTAAEQGNQQMVEFLLQEGADPSQKNSGGKTAAQIAQAKDKRGSHSGVIRTLGGA